MEGMRRQKSGGGISKMIVGVRMRFKLEEDWL